jgi:hypothetical protein
VKALGQFGLRNAPDLAGFVADTIRGRLGRRLPGRRTLMALTPERVAVLQGGRVAGAWGAWPGSHQDQPEQAEQAEDAPVGIGAVLGWESGDGVVALPVRWEPSTCTAQLPGALADMAGLAGAARASVVADDYGAPGPAAKSGILLRGEGRREGNAVRVEADRVTAWDGVATSTEPAA